MSVVDWVVLCATLGLVVLYGLWRSRGRSGLDHYMLAGRPCAGTTVALSVMATQASAVTFIHPRAGVCRRDALRAVLLRPAAQRMVILRIRQCRCSIPREVFTAYQYSRAAVD